MARHRTTILLHWTIIWFLAAPGGCGDPHGGERPAEASQQIRRYVAFRQSAYTINRLETSTVPPVAVGSTLSADLLSSSDSSIVSIDAAGNLVAHKNGEAIVRGAGGASLHVLVNAVQALRVLPDLIEIAPGERAAVRLLGDGRELSSGAYTWETTDPNIAAGFGSSVQAGDRPGQALLTVRSGSSQATVNVTVRAGRHAPLRFMGTAPTMKVGRVEQLRAQGPPGVPLVWSSTKTTVLEPLRDGLFYARAAGTADACVEAQGRRSCRSIRVVR